MGERGVAGGGCNCSGARGWDIWGGTGTQAVWHGEGVTNAAVEGEGSTNSTSRDAIGGGRESDGKMADPSTAHAVREGGLRCASDGGVNAAVGDTEALRGWGLPVCQHCQARGLRGLLLPLGPRRDFGV